MIDKNKNTKLKNKWIVLGNMKQIFIFFLVWVTIAMIKQH